MRLRAYVTAPILAISLLVAAAPATAMQAMPGVKPQSGAPQQAAAMPAVGEKVSKTGAAVKPNGKTKKTAKSKKRASQAAANR